jgi:hypothetical protein
MCTDIVTIGADLSGDGMYAVLCKIPDIYNEYRYVNIIFFVLLVALLLSPFFFFRSIPDVINCSLPNQINSCFYKVHTGNKCPTCGLTRSILSLYYGNIELSRYYHPAGVLFVGLLFGQTLMRVIVFFKKNIALPYMDMIQVILTACFFSYVIT